MTTNFDAILAQLQNVRANGKGYTALCPAHADQHRSLSIARGDDGKILLHCFAGCEPETIASALGLQMRELFSQNGHTRGQIAATYDYTDERGALVYQCVRFMPKDFRQRRPDGAGGWQWNLNGTRRVLYRLPDLLARSDEIVFVVEGEKDADNLARLGLLATTNAGGANNWRDEYAESLRGRLVVIIPDNDDAGRKHAHRVAQSLQDGAASVKVLELSNLPPKGDVSDWLQAGGTKEMLLELAARASMYADASETAHYLPYSDILEAYHRAETGDAEILARLFAERIAFDHAEKSWHLFKKHFWDRDETGRVEKFVTDELAAQYLFVSAERKRQNGDDADKQVKELYARANSLRNRNKIANVLDRARKQDALALRGDEWDRDAMLLGVGNGVLNLRYRDFEFRDGAPRDYVRTIAPTQWQDLYTPAPRFEQFLQEIFAADAEIIAFIQRWFGYCLTADVSENAFVVLHGEDGRNGKRILTETIARVMGGYATAGDDDLFLDSRDRAAGAPKQFLIDLAARRLVLLSETKEGARFNLARIKQLAGGDTIKARGMFAPRGVEIAPTWKFVLSTNRLPHADSDDAAFFERIFVVRLTQRFVTHPDPANPNEHPRDAKLDQTLRAEQSGILAWLVRGCLEWQSAGLNPPESVRMATQEYRAGEDTLAQWQSERCFVGTNAEMKAADGYADYRQWAADNGLTPMSGTAFWKRIGKRFNKKHTNAGAVYFGIGLLQK